MFPPALIFRPFWRDDAEAKTFPLDESMSCADILFDDLNTASLTMPAFCSSALCFLDLLLLHRDISFLRDWCLLLFVWVPKERNKEQTKKYHNEENINYVIQINGKKRGLIQTKPNITEEKLFEIMRNDEKIMKYFDQKNIKKKIYIKDKILNIII